jgi:SNF2 family DNA or RNA helicase
MLQNHDTIAAGQEMADLPVFDEFNATTVADQNKRFREQSSKNPNADKGQIHGDNVMLNRARSALRNRYKVMGDKFLVKGMKTPLFAYQFVATGWMVGREKSDEGPHGGILADAMGLGKTVEALACIAGNPPSEEDRERGLRTTLIIVPASAIGQWIEEVWKHCDGIHVSHYKRSDILNQAGREYSSIW